MGKSRRSRSRKRRRSRRGGLTGSDLTAQRMKKVDAAIAAGKKARDDAAKAQVGVLKAASSAQKAAAAAPKICANPFMKDSKKCKKAAAGVKEAGQAASAGIASLKERKQKLRDAGMKIGGKRHKKRRTKRRRKKRKSRKSKRKSRRSKRRRKSKKRKSRKRRR